MLGRKKKSETEITPQVEDVPAMHIPSVSPRMQRTRKDAELMGKYYEEYMKTGIIKPFSVPFPRKDDPPTK